MVICNLDLGRFKKIAPSGIDLFWTATFCPHPTFLNMVTYPRAPPQKTVKSPSIAGDTEVDLYLGAEWQTPLARVLTVRLPYATLLRTLAEASSFLTSFPMNVDGTVGTARIAVFSAVQSGKKFDIETATSAVEAVIDDKRMA